MINDTKYYNLSVYNNINYEIRNNRLFYNKITESNNNKDKSADAKLSIAFLSWFLIHEFNPWDSTDEIDDVIVDGSDDNQIDAVVHSNDTLFLIQAKFTEYPIYYENGLEDVETLWKKLAHRSGEKIANPNNQLEAKLDLINKYVGDASKKVCIILVTPTDVANREEWNTLKNRIENSSSKFEVQLFNFDNLRNWASVPNQSLYTAIKH